MKAGIVPQGPLAEDSETSLTRPHDKMKTSSVNQEVGFHQTHSDSVNLGFPDLQNFEEEKTLLFINYIIYDFLLFIKKSLCKILGIMMVFLDTMYVSRFSSHIFSLPCGTSSLPSAFMPHVPFDLFQQV